MWFQIVLFNLFLIDDLLRYAVRFALKRSNTVDLFLFKFCHGVTCEWQQTIAFSRRIKWNGLDNDHCNLRKVLLSPF